MAEGDIYRLPLLEYLRGLPVAVGIEHGVAIVISASTGYWKSEKRTRILRDQQSLNSKEKSLTGAKISRLIAWG